MGVVDPQFFPKKQNNPLKIVVKGVPHEQLIGKQ
jgi:hypothetical protein